MDEYERAAASDAKSGRLEKRLAFGEVFETSVTSGTYAFPSFSHFVTLTVAYGRRSQKQLRTRVACRFKGHEAREAYTANTYT